MRVDSFPCDSNGINVVRNSSMSACLVAFKTIKECLHGALFVYRMIAR